MNVEMPAETTESRGAVFDLKCKDRDGSVFIIEIQNAPQTYFYDRGLYYLCRVVSNQDEKGEGLAEGKAEEQRLIAANFKKQGIAIEAIAQCTGLSIEEIESLE